MAETVRIQSLGAKGDGVAELAGKPTFVPFTLPGELVEIGSGPTNRILEPSSERRPAPCPHFGACGGCDVQHASEEFYRAWKRDLVVQALARRGIETEVDGLVPCPPASRRRAVFSASRQGGRVQLGFFEAESHRLADLSVCLVVVPAIASRLDDLRKLAALVIDRRRPARLTVTATASGLDIAVSEAARLEESSRQALICLALQQDFARLTVNGEAVVEARRPVIDVAGTAMVPPPGGFLQAVAEAEAAMADLTLGYLKGARQVADLFAGSGAFALRLAKGARVHAVESDAPALSALDQAARHAGGLKPVTSERRDLFRRPLTAKELSRFDGIVFDPPRVGAEALCHELARAQVTRLVAVSCNPTTLARDLNILLVGGFRLQSVTPIDQFLWSHHVEAVALLTR
ncbi:class I SAM-dependent RNA methyltransferase [Consotaella salsifontis]|uniref:23S rRNA m(5)U-1939 methyltransferase n=1 Tax=Consotaella salsifontis TaxID=1365950 RepID=A0A1T4MZ88_9HYPH|nr:class I SAM-dependent RNA methyltransferase [Consotaella salsifontis]SJZ72164.1 23S rRNA m(5)U-1939 methyltransferase [Consotaella salsifontis]